MFIVSLKMTKAKLIGLLGLTISIICSGTILGVYAKETREAMANTDGGINEQNYIAKTNQGRTNFLRSFGWEVEEIPVSTDEVKIPEKFDEVMENYNAIQLEQGFDLSGYCGKKVKKYTYIIHNYPNEPEGIRANIFVYKDRIIGGDICSIAADGFIQGFEMP